MKRHLAYVFLVLGCLGFLAQGLVILQKEKEYLALQVSTQKNSVKEGLKAKWRSFLLEKARLGELPKSYKLYWNRQGTELRNPFFPVHPSMADWADYQRDVANHEMQKAKKFLKRILKLENSWDRALAIEEWKKQFKSLPEIPLSAYEKTLVDPEARSSYKLIFDQFDGHRDFTFISPGTQLDIVFYLVTEDGSILSFLPSTKDLTREFLQEFLTAHSLASLKFGPSIWEIQFEFKDLQKERPQFTLLLASLILLLGGIVLYLRSIQEEKRQILRRVTFLNQIVHEIKTPLAGLKLHVQLISSGLGQKENYVAIEESIERIDHLFDDIVLMNRPQEEFQTQSLSSEELFVILEDLRFEFGAVELQPFTIPNVRVEPSRLRIILRNLIKNAIRYGKKAHVKLEVFSTHVSLLIWDEGEGISSEESQRIFDEFYRTSSSKKSHPDGLGLGLFLAKKMAREMGSEIILKNPGQAGACFEITLKGEKK